METQTWILVIVSLQLLLTIAAMQRLAEIQSAVLKPITDAIGKVEVAKETFLRTAGKKFGDLNGKIGSVVGKINGALHAPPEEL